MCPHCRQIFNIPDRPSEKRPDTRTHTRRIEPTIRCTSCQSAVPASAKFCEQCGGQVEVEAVAADAPPTVSEDAPGLTHQLAQAEQERDDLREKAASSDRARQGVEQDYQSELQALHEKNESLQSHLRGMQEKLKGPAPEEESGETPDGPEVTGRMAELESRLREMEALLNGQRSETAEQSSAGLEEYQAFMNEGERSRSRLGTVGLVDSSMFEGAGSPRPRSGQQETGRQAQSHRDIRAIGLDFGTTNSLGSYYKGVAIRGIFQISRGEREGYRELMLPSTIGYLERENRFVVGYEAEDIPRRTLGFRKIRSIKRCLLCNGVDAQGRCANNRNAHNHDICGQGMAPWRLGRRRFETEEIIAEYLGELFRRIEAQYDVELTPEKINFTVPIYFGYVARKKLRAAIRIAFQLLRGKPMETEGLDDRIRLVHEPTAAAISQYNQFRDMPDEVFGIFDMGGGTTDVAIYEKRKENLWCLASGSLQVGGDDFDQKLLGLIERRMAGWPVDRRKTETRRVLDDFFENLTAVRETLSSELSYERVFHFPEGDFALSLSQEAFEAEIVGMLARAVDSLVRIYEDVSPILQTFEKKLSAIYLVGGVTKTPLVRRALQEAFADRAPEVQVRPVSKFAGISAPAEARKILEEEFNLVSVAIGAGFPEVNFLEFLLDKIPFEIGIVLQRDAQLDPLPAPQLVPFYKAHSPVPHRCSRRLIVSQCKDNTLQIYMKREGQSLHKIIKYIRFPIRERDRVRPIDSDVLCELNYEIAMEITKDQVLINFDGIAQETATVPGTHPYYLQRDLNIQWVSRLSTVTDLIVKYNGRRKKVRGERIQEYLRRHVKESEPVHVVENHDGKQLVVHQEMVIGYLRPASERAEAEPLPREGLMLRLLREDILLPEDMTTEQMISRNFRAGDPFIVFDLAAEE